MGGSKGTAAIALITIRTFDGVLAAINAFDEVFDHEG